MSVGNIKVLHSSYTLPKFHYLHNVKTRKFDLVLLKILHNFFIPPNFPINLELSNIFRNNNFSHFDTAYQLFHLLPIKWFSVWCHIWHPYLRTYFMQFHFKVFLKIGSCRANTRCHSYGDTIIIRQKRLLSFLLKSFNDERDVWGCTTVLLKSHAFHFNINNEHSRLSHIYGAHSCLFLSDLIVLKDVKTIYSPWPQCAHRITAFIDVSCIIWEFSST